MDKKTRCPRCGREIPSPTFDPEGVCTACRDDERRFAEEQRRRRDDERTVQTMLLIVGSAG